MPRHGLGWCLLAGAKILPESVLRCVGSDGAVFWAILWPSGVIGVEVGTEDKGKAGALAKAPGALLLPGLSRPPGTEYQLDSALCLPHGNLELGWPKERRQRGCREGKSSWFCNQLQTKTYTSSSPSASAKESRFLSCTRKVDFYFAVLQVLTWLGMTSNRG